MSKLEVDAIEPQSGTTITIGSSGDTVNLIGTLNSNGSPLPGDISEVVAGTGLSGGGTTGAVTINIEAAQPTITSLGTITGFTSTGIDDNADATAITIDSSESLGLGTTTPFNSRPGSFTISNEAPTIYMEDTNGSGDKVGQILYQNAELSYSTGSRNGTGTSSSTEHFRITSAGRVGIGLTNPVENLQISDTASNKPQIRLETSDGGNKRLDLYVDGSIGTIASDQSAQSLAFRTAGSERMRINSSGSVGIGTTSAESLLHLSSASPVITFQETDQSNRKFQIGSFGNAYAIYDATNTQYRYILDNSGNHIFNEGSQDCDFRVESNTHTHGLFLDGGTGNVSIGLSGPTYRLQLTSVYETADSPKVFKAFNNSAGSTSSPQYTYWDMAGHGGADRVRFISYDYSQNSGTRSRFNIQTSVDGGSLADRFTIENDGRVNVNEKLCIGGATTSGKFAIATNAGTVSRMISLTDTGNAGGGRDYIEFFNVSGGTAGSIEHNGTSTVAFLTSSDYRLKENVSYDFDATTRIKQLKPARFNFITDADKTVDGFLAHEVSSVVPEAISGTKDETKTKEKVVVNSYGNVIAENIEQEDWEIDKTAADKKYPTDSTWEATKLVPEYQSIDQSKLVPLLVKTIQELEARITTLENA